MFFYAKNRRRFSRRICFMRKCRRTFANSHNILRIAATTSLDNSGLLASLIPLFEKECQCRVRVIVAGTGKALKLGERGDVDMLLVHAPETGKAIYQKQTRHRQTTIMHNTFILRDRQTTPPPRQMRQASARRCKS